MEKIKRFLINNKIALIVGIFISIGVFTNEAKDYTDENNQLKIEISNIETEIEAKNKEIIDKSAPELQQEIDTAKAEIERLSSENSTFTKEKNELNEQYKAKQKDQKQNRLNQLLGKIKIDYDAVEKTAWVYRAGNVNVNDMGMYLGVKDNNVWPRLKIRYTADEWLFIDKYKIVADSKEFNIYPSKVERDNDHRIWEWYDWYPSDSDLRMIETISNSGNVIVRHIGSHYNKDRTISDAEKTGMKNILELYNLLKESNIKVENGQIIATIK